WERASTAATRLLRETTWERASLVLPAPTRRRRQSPAGERLALPGPGRCPNRFRWRRSSPFGVRVNPDRYRETLPSRRANPARPDTVSPSWDGPRVPGSHQRARRDAWQATT